MPAYPHLPVALTEDQPIGTVSIEALAELARTVGGALPSLPRHPGLDILRKAAAVPSASRGQSGSGTADGPPTTSRPSPESLRTWTTPTWPCRARRAPARRTWARTSSAAWWRRGWKVGVVGQSHTVVENMLCRAIETGGVDPDRVGKKLAAPHPGPRGPSRPTATSPGCWPGPEGALVGGTAWTMTGKEVPPGSLDLLVIDEAGQYSLANTLAVSRAARRLLLLGDPQQLPQVTQGTHPEPVDESALGWLSAGHATLPPELGYFLADSLADAPGPVRGGVPPELRRAAEVGARRGAAAPGGATAGVETVFVEHTGNATCSVEEAAEVLRQARRHLGLSWTPGAGRRPRAAGAGGHPGGRRLQRPGQPGARRAGGRGAAGVRVGTVDKFQGQEAPVVIVTHGVLGRGRGAARHGVPAQPQPHQRGSLARAVAGCDRPLARAHQPHAHRPAALEELGAFIGLSPREGAQLYRPGQ